jgi:hypothetical protein
LLGADLSSPLYTQLGCGQICEKKSQLKGHGEKFPTSNPQSEIRNPKSAAPNPQSEIRNPKSAAPNPQSEILNPQSAIPNPQSEIT